MKKLKGKMTDHLSKGEEGEVILDKTPFYAESGGQVGDQGYIVTEKSRCYVFDTFTPQEGLIVHRVTSLVVISLPQVRFDRG